MYLEERYSKMTDSEVLERYKDFDSCFYVAQIIILKELEKRKLISEEKIKLHYQEINDKKEKEKSGKLAKEKKAMSKGKRVVLALGILFIIKVILPVSLFYMGNSAYRNNEYPKAEKLYRVSSRLSKEWTPSSTMLGTVLVIEKKYKEAIAPLTFAKDVYEKRGEEDGWALRGLAEVYLNLGDYEKFEELYPRAVKATKDKELLGYFYKDIAVYYWTKANGDKNKALFYIDKAIESSQIDFFYYIRGDIYRILGDYDKAIKNFLIDIEKQERIEDDAYYVISVCYVEGLNDFKNGLKYIDYFIKFYDDFFNYNSAVKNEIIQRYDAYYVKADILRKMGDYKGAKEYTLKVIDYDKNKILNQNDYIKSVQEAKKILKSMEKR